MPDYIGGSTYGIAVPEITPSELSWPIVPDYGYGQAEQPEVRIHQFGSGNAKIEQRYLLGNGLRTYRLSRAGMTKTEREALYTLWLDTDGAAGTFYYTPPGAEDPILCRFADPILSWEMLGPALASAQLILAEVPDPATAPTYTVNSTVTRFPGSTLAAALLAQAQQIVPLVCIMPVGSQCDPVYISDRRCTVGGQLYQARMLSWDGIGQTLSTEGGSDQATFILGNADRVIRDFANAIDLNRAAIEFSFYHVGSGILCNLWKGHVTNWAFDGGDTFTINASDGLYELTLPYPRRRISPSCWKKANDGVNCPMETRGGSHLTEICDKSFKGPKGCQYHTMDNYFGGIAPVTEEVHIKDNSTGVWGYRRQNITSVSAVSDSIYDQIVPEVYTNVPMAVNAKLFAGREESDYYIAGGIVSEGPIGGYVTGTSTLDGQTSHDANSAPSGEARGETPNTVALSLEAGGVTGPERAAGTAFLIIRRNDEKGFQPSRLSEHSMVAQVARGMSGWVWTAIETRTWQVLSNPVWVAVNARLRAFGLVADETRSASAAICETHFDVTAAIAAAAICDTPVTPMYERTVQVWIPAEGHYDEGTGEWVEDTPGYYDPQVVTSEPQFQFRGILQEQKPLRDWLQEILNNSQGYFTFANGKLKIGIRVNSSTVEAFTEGNIIWKSLSLAPRNPQFNDLTASFADEEFKWASNTVQLYDEDHAALIGGETSPLRLPSQMNLCGTSTKSQAARIITTRLREELGGITAAEWKAARRIGFRTTVLALNTEPGMVCSMTHADMPGGVGEFRVTSWRLNPDWSIDIEGKTTTDSMYDLTSGPKPVDVLPSMVPIEYYYGPLDQVWHPNQETPISGDPLYGATDSTFGLAQEYTTLADGSSQALLVVIGDLPINAFMAGVKPCTIVSAAAQAATGSLKAATKYWVCVCGLDAAGKLSPPSNVVTVTMPAGADTFSIILSPLKWPDYTYTGYAVFAGLTEKTMCFQATAATDSPASITFAGPLSESTYNMPSPLYRNVRAKAKLLYHAGVIGEQITGVTSTTITCGALAGSSDDWAGRIISIIADESDGSAPPWNFLCSTFNGTTGEFTVTPDPEAAGVDLQDVITIRLKPTAVGPLTITDAKFQNFVYPAGMNVDEEIGRFVRIIGGPGKGQVRRITSNTATQITVDRAFDPLPTADSTFIVEAADWRYFSESTPQSVSETAKDVRIGIVADNLIGQSILATAVILNIYMEESDEELSHVREIYMFGSKGADSLDNIIVEY